MQTTNKPYLKSIHIEKPQGKEANQFPFTIPAVKSIDYLDFHPDVTFLVGENGSGKSTILEAIAVNLKLPRMGGDKNFDFDSKYGNSQLNDHLKCQKSHNRPQNMYFLRAESMYEKANMTMQKLVELNQTEGYYAKTSRMVHTRSHGETFMSLMTTQLKESGLYLLDEPEAALSATRLLSALVRMEDLVNAESQFIIATHSPILLSYPRSRIYLFDEAGCRQVSFEETEHFRVTKDFLNNYPKRIQQLLRPTPLLDWLEENAESEN